MIGGSLRRVRAVAVRELRDLGRSRTPFVLRLTFAAVIGAILTLALNPLAARNGGEMEPEMLAFMTAGVFKGVVYFQTFVVLLIGAMLGVISSTAERSNKTLGLIVLSRLRAGEVVVGKLLALLGLMVMVLLAAVPLFALLGWGGGMDYGWLARSGLLLMVVSFLSLTIGLALGWTMSTFAFAAVLSAIVSLSAYLIPLMMGFRPWAGASSSSISSWGPIKSFFVEWMPVTWIGNSVEAVGSQGVSGVPFYRPLLFNAAVGLVLACCAALRMRYSAINRQSKGLRGSFEALDRLFERINVGGVRFGGSSRRFAGNPVAALGSTMSGLGSTQYAVRIGLVMFLFSVVVFMGAVDDRDWVAPVLVVAMLLLPLLPLAYGAGAVAGERERKSLTVLLATPLSAGRILGGKARTALRLFATVTLPALVIIVGLLPLHVNYDFDVVAWMTAIFLAESYVAFRLGAAASLFAGSALRASMMAVVLMFAINVLPMLGAGASTAVFHSSAPSGLRAWVLGIVAVVGLVTLVMIRRLPPPATRLLVIFLALSLGTGLLAGFPIDDRQIADHLVRWLDKQGMDDGWSVPALFAAYLLIAGTFLAGATWREFDRSLGRSR